MIRSIFEEYICNLPHNLLHGLSYVLIVNNSISHTTYYIVCWLRKVRLILQPLTLSSLGTQCSHTS